MTYLINRLLSHTNQIYSPLSSIKIPITLCFGFWVAYASRTLDLTIKLQLRALPCVFLDYASTQKGYRCLHNLRSKIYISRNVQFVESIFPFQPQAQPGASLAQPPTDSHLQLFLLHPLNSA